MACTLRPCCKFYSTLLARKPFDGLENDVDRQGKRDGTGIVNTDQVRINDRLEMSVSVGITFHLTGLM